MKVAKHVSESVDIKTFLHGKLSAVERDDSRDEDWEEEDSEIPAATFCSNLLRLGTKVSSKLFSVELGKITF